MNAPETFSSSEVVLAENRDIEKNNEIEKNLVADHVWRMCRPHKFSSGSPAVTARRIQMIRLQLQNNPRLLDLEPEVITVSEDEIGETTYESPLPTKFSSGTGSSEKKSEKSLVFSSKMSSRKKITEKSSFCSADELNYWASKKRPSDKASVWSEGASPMKISGKPSACSVEEEIFAKNSKSSLTSTISYSSEGICPETNLDEEVEESQEKNLEECSEGENIEGDLEECEGEDDFQVPEIASPSYEAMFKEICSNKSEESEEEEGMMSSDDVTTA